MSISRQDLLQPSLTDRARLASAPYSLQTGGLAAFFGGPFAAALMLAINAKRVGRLKRDALWAVAMALLFVGWLFFVYRTAPGLALQAQLVGLLGRNALGVLARLLALLAFLVAAYLHRREQRSADLFGLKRPNGLWLGIALIVLGEVLSMAVIAALTWED